ncbi:MAG: TonB-dependent receptor [Flavobacteriales bacterium]|jgi:iron complex outermembrane recepter protein|tara:strand:+ start:57 stop:2282 length:2226 start_codon:yes stop_codon:yes gene_type:complete
MKNILLVSFLMMHTFNLFSQTKGKVIDSNNFPVKDVNVFLSDQNILLYSNNDGTFISKQDIPNNSYIHFYKFGYASKVIKYKSDQEFKVILEDLHINLDEVGVVESFSELGNTKLTNIEKKSLEDVFLKNNSMVESIAQLAGVDIVSSGLGIQKVVVRGLSGMRVVTYLNGMQINNQQWANDHGIGFTDLGLGEVELIKGSSALKYGSEAIGGLLYFKDSPFISSDKLKGFFATKFNNSSYLSSSQFGIKWNKNNFYFNLYGQYSLSSDYRLPNNTYLFNSRFNQNAIKFSLAHRYKKLQNIFMYQYHNEITGIPAHAHVDPADVNISDITSSFLDLSTDFKATRPTQFINNQLFIYKLNYLNNNIKLSLHAGHFINNLQEYEKWSSPAFDLTISNTQITPNIRYKLDRLTFNLGSQISVLDNKNNEDLRLVPDASSLNIGPYFILDYEKNNFGYNSGIRYDYKSLKSEDKISNVIYDNEFSNTSFSTGVFYKFNDNVFRLTYSGAFRAPHFSELFSDGVHHGTNRYELGNQNLDIEYASQYEFKYQWSNEHFGFVLNPFLQNISDFISIVPTDSFINSFRVYNYMQYNKVEIKGVEINLHYHPHQLHNLHFEQSYSFLQTINKDDQYGLALVPANSIKTNILFDFNEYERLVKYKLDYFSLFHIYKFSQEYFAEYEELTKSYNLINLQLGLKFNDKLLCSIGLNNLFNKQYSPHTSRIRSVAGGVPNPGRSFNINLKYEF